MSRRSAPYISDPLLMPRITQYLSENRDKVYIDLNEMVNDLQNRYKEYGRRKSNIFRCSVRKAFGAVLQHCGLSQSFPAVEPNQSDNSSTDVEECFDDDQERFKSSSNNQLLNLYASRNPRFVPRVSNRSSTQSAELIDLSSDDEDIEKKEEVEELEELATRTVRRNGMPSTSFTKDPPTNPPNKGPGKPERMVPPSRKRKHTPLPGRVPSLAMKEKNPLFQPPKINFSDFAGNQKALEEVCKLILHIQHPEFYRKIGLTSPRGFLLHGPPGCGKTLLAAAIAGELKVHFIKVSAPELVGGVSGESEERIRELFENAVEYAPCVLFIDEVDAITPNRQNAQREMERRIVAQLLTCLDELNNVPNGDQVLVIGATNRPDSLDPALRRAGRFDREVCLGIPDLKARQQILKVLCKNLKMSPRFSYEEVAMNTPGFVGADLLSLTREAAMIAVNRAFVALQKRNEKKDSKKKKIKLDAKQSPAGKSGSAENTRALSSAKGDSGNAADTVAPTGEVMDLESANKPDDAAREKEVRERGTEEGIEKSKLDKEEYPKQKIDDDEGMKEKENETKSNKAKESESYLDKDGSDMDIAETVSEESVTGGDIEICKDDSLKTVGSDDESEVEVLTANVEAESPDLETLLSWIRCGHALNLNKLENLSLTQDDFTRALRFVQPSAKREGFATVPDVTWDDVGSLADVREELKMSILGPVKMKKQFENLGLTAPSGILICGPPGCGKTLLAKAVANEAGINFISVKGPELLNMYVGESERAVRQCFQRAKNSAPCVIFFDELDALCPKRSGSGENIASSRVVNQMLTEMDGVEDRKEVYLMAATNRPDIVDPAVLRPGRLDKVLYVGLPQEKDRIEILKALTKNGTRPKLARDVDLVNIAKRPECNGYSGADLAALVREAGIQALKDLIKKGDLDMDADVEVAEEHFLRALKLIRPSVSAEDRLHYEHLKQKYCSSTSTGF